MFGTEVGELTGAVSDWIIVTQQRITDAQHCRRTEYAGIGEFRRIQMPVLVCNEKEDFVFLDRPAEASVQVDILVESLGQPLNVVEEVRRLRVLVAEFAADRAVQRVAAALGHDVDGAAVSEPKFSRVSVAVDLKFLDGIVGDCCDAILPGAVLILAAIDSGEVVPPVAAADGKSGGAKTGEARGLGARRVG